MTTTTAQELTGVVVDMPEAEYHAHPALSSSQARRLLPPHCPAIFKWERDNGRPEKKAFDIGHAAHGLVLGVGMDVVVVQRTARDGAKSDADNYQTKSAQEHREAVYAEGKVPLLAREWAEVQRMANALDLGLRAVGAGALFDPEAGRSELSLFWRDERYDVDRRARLDWFSERLVVDYKTTTDANPRACAKSLYKFGYHMQGAWYVDAALATGLTDEAGFLLVFQETTPPYLVTVVEPDQPALRVGRALNDRALEVYAECTANNTWPGYSDGIETVSLPAWALTEYMEGTA